MVLQFKLTTPFFNDLHQHVEISYLSSLAHIFASFNETFVHVIDGSGKETLAHVTGGMKVKADKLNLPRTQPCLLLRMWLKSAVTGGNKTKTPGPGAKSTLQALACFGMWIRRIEDVIPIPIDSTRRKDGRRGCQL
ncbi:hypothetical protein L7F22_020895 [Adiantum nelumboides]|nr:hypothetical protein [Adiantum nelumboides]